MFGLTDAKYVAPWKAEHVKNWRLLCGRNLPQIFFVFIQHLDIAALLIKYNADVNATDRWHFTPLHEAAQKGRTQLCALLV